MADFAKKAFWVSTSDVATKGFGFIATVYLARILGAEMYGLITVALSTLGYLMWIADLGLSNIGVRETAIQAEKRTFRAKEIFITKLVIGLIVFFIASITLPFFELSELQANVIQMYLFAIIPYSLSIEWFFNGKQEYAKLALAKTSQTGIYLLLVYMMVNGADDVAIIPKLYLITSVLSISILFALLFTVSFESLSFRSFRSVTDLIKKGSYIGFGGFFAQTVNLLPPIVIAYSFSLRETGIYTAAFKVILIAMILDKVFVTLLIPSLSKQWSEDKGQALENVKRTFRLLLIIGFTGSLLIISFASPLIQLLFGIDYLESTDILRVLSFFVALTFLNSLFSFGLISMNKEREYLKATFSGGVCAAILIIGFGFSAQTLWIAYSVVFAEFFLLAFSIYEFRKIMPFNFYSPVILVLTTSALLAYVQTYIELDVILSGIIVIVLFLGLMSLFRILRLNDLQWLNKKLY